METDTIDDCDTLTGIREDSLNDGKQLSKRQRKKLEKKKHWESVKLEKRAEERRRLKEKRRQRKENGETLPISRKRLKQNTMKDSQCKLRVAIDCSFDDIMAEKDVFAMVTQINYAYAANRRATNPLQFYVTGLENKTKARLDSLDHVKHWDINFTDKGYIDTFGAENVVYLSSDSSNVLETLDEDKAYIIGGLVDHNHHKGLCFKLAEEKGLAHAQLPISEFVNMKTRQVLTINHVFEILLYYTESKDWEEAFFKAIPQRKGVLPKSQPKPQSTETVSKSSSDQDDHSQVLSKCGECSQIEDCVTETESSATCDHKEKVVELKIESLGDAKTGTGCVNETLADHSGMESTSVKDIAFKAGIESECPSEGKQPSDVVSEGKKDAVSEKSEDSDGKRGAVTEISEDSGCGKVAGLDRSKEVEAENS